MKTTSTVLCDVMADDAPSTATEITSHVLESEDVRVTLLSLGCIVQDWQVAGRSVTLGYDRVESYLDNRNHFGEVVGRVANRIRNGHFSLLGRDYRLPITSPPHHLHGGPLGFGRRLWRADPDGSRGVLFSLHSPDRDQGYPGAVDVEVFIKLTGHRLIWEMTAKPDQPTPINLAQHLYFNLNGSGAARGHVLYLNADSYTPNDETGCPTGQIVPVADTQFDFRTARSLNEADIQGQGFDHNMVLNMGRGRPTAELTGSDLHLRLWTDQPGLQLYDGGNLASTGAALPGQSHQPGTAICLEAQGFPNAPNEPAFPSIICTPDQPYFQRTEIEIAPKP